MENIKKRLEQLLQSVVSLPSKAVSGAVEPIQQKLQDWAIKNPQKAEALLTWEPLLNPAQTVRQSLQSQNIRTPQQFANKIIIEVPKEFVDYMGGTLRSTPKLFEQTTTTLTKPLVGEKASSLLGKSVGTYVEQIEAFPRGLYEKKPLIQHVGDLLRTVGAIKKPGDVLATAGLNILLKSGGTLLSEKRLPTTEEITESTQEGIKFGSLLGPLGGLAGTMVKPLSKTITGGKEFGNINSWVRIWKNAPVEAKATVFKEATKRFGKEAFTKALEGGLGFGTYEALSSEGTPQERIKKGLEGATTGAIFGAGTYGLGQAASYTFPRIKSGVLSSYKEGRIPFALSVRPKGGIKAILKAEEAKTTVLPAGSPFAPTEIPKGMKERGFIKTVRESPTTAPEVAEEVKGFYTPKPNKQLLAEAKERIAKSYDESKSFVMENKPKTLDELDQIIATGELLMEKAQKGKRFDEAIEIAEKLAEHGTRLGRGVQAFSIWGRLTPQGMLRYGEKMIKKAEKEGGLRIGKIEELTNEEKKLIIDYMQKAKETTDPEEQAKFIKLAMETINQKIPWKASELFDFYRINNILSNPRSHMRNIWGNLINSLFVQPATLVAEGKPVEAVKYEVGALKSLPDAIEEGMKAFKGEILDYGKLDIKELRQKKVPLLLSSSFRALEAMDKFFSRLVEGGEIARGKTPEEAKRFADYLLYRVKVGDAKAQGWLLDFLDKTIGSLLTKTAQTPVINWFVPFARTPFNFAKMQVEYSPLGFANLPGAENKSTQFAKAALGTFATLIGAKLALEGKITFAAPTDEKAREWFYATGKKPFSVQIGDKWVPVAYFGPFGMSLLLPAMYKYYAEEVPTALTSGDLEKLSQVASSIIYYWSQQTPLAGIGIFVDLVRGRTDLNVFKNLGFTASQVIPYTGLLNYVAQVLDPIYRKPKGFGEQIIAGIPGLSKKIKEYYKTPTGEPAKRPLSAYTAPYTLGTKEEKWEPFYQERIQELQQNKLINKIKKLIEEGEEITPEEAALILDEQAEKTNAALILDEQAEKTNAALILDEQAEKTKAPLQALVERKKLQAKFNKADQFFDLYLQAPDEKTAQEIEKNIGKLGIDFNEGLYNYLSKQDVAVKTDYVKAIVENVNPEKKLEVLASLRKEGVATGKKVLSDGVIDNLYDEGLISAEEKKYLKNLVWLAKEKKVKVKKEGGGGKKVKIGKPPEARRVQIRKIEMPRVKIKMPEPIKLKPPEVLRGSRTKTRLSSKRTQELVKLIRQAGK